MAEQSTGPVSAGEGGRTAVVVGAGIAGILTAQALTRLGYRVRLLEREPRLRTEGAGLSLWPNALTALEQLGCDEAVGRCAHQIPEGATYTPEGRVIAQAPLDLIGRRYGPLVSVHRGEFLEALLDCAGVPVEYGAAVSAGEDGLRLGGEELDADLIVGADGIGSVVREAVCPEVAPRRAGYGAWRGVAQTGSATPAGASETLGPGRRFGLVPLSGERTYWFAVLGDGDEDLSPEEAFGEWHDPIARVLSAPQADDRFYLDLADLPPLTRWHQSRTVLVGDAAHAMTPNLGQGAAQSIIDVSVLARELAAQPLDRALRNYERARKRTTERIVRQSRQMGRVAQVSNPLGSRLRNFFVAHTPPRLVAKQMGRVIAA